MLRAVLLVQLTRGVIWHKVRPLHSTATPFGRDFHSGDGIELTERKVREVIVGKAAPAQGRHDQSQTTETRTTTADTSDIGQADTLVITDHHILDASASVDQQAECAVGIGGERGDTIREFGGDEHVPTHALTPDLDRKSRV